MIADHQDFARSVDTWRRLALAFGPRTAIPVAMMIAELARDLDGGLVTQPSHELLAAALRATPRTVERQVAVLIDAGWLERIGPRAARGNAQLYALRWPVDVAAVELAASLEPDMWRRLLGLADLESPATDGQTVSPQADTSGTHPRNGEHMSDPTQTDCIDQDIGAALRLLAARATEVYVNDAGSITIRQRDPDADDLVTLTADQAATVAAELERLVALRTQWERTVEREP